MNKNTGKKMTNGENKSVIIIGSGVGAYKFLLLLRTKLFKAIAHTHTFCTNFVN